MIVGAMKAGSSSLFNLLRQHPQICASHKEPEFFSQHQDHRVEVERYENLFDFDSKHHRYCLEASTGYTKFPEETGVAERIAAYGLSPRIVYIARDPVERFASHINYYLSNDHAWSASMTSDVNALYFSMYHRQILPYVEAFGKDSILVLNFDDLKHAPTQLATHVFEWLGLPGARVDAEVSRNATAPRSAAEIAIMRSPAHKIRELFPQGLRDRVKAVLRSRSESVVRDLTAEEARQLRAVLREDILAFGHMFDVPVERWGFSETDSS